MATTNLDKRIRSYELLESKLEAMENRGTSVTDPTWRATMQQWEKAGSALHNNDCPGAGCMGCNNDPM